LTSPAWNSTEATVRRVANHTAGLTTFNPPRKHLSIHETIQRYGVIFWPPGERYDYSNLGYKILDEVVARVSAVSHSNFMRNEIFWPLGMTHTSVGIGFGLEKFVAQRYSVSRGLQPPVEDAVYCSARDLVRFGMFCLKTRLLDQKRILSDAAIDALYQSPISTGDSEYSLGWRIDNDRFGYRSILAQGGTDAAQAWLRLIPSEEIVAVALANHGMMSSAMVDEVVSALLPKYGELRAQADQKKSSPASQSAPPPATFVGTWKGIIKTYREDIPLTFSITESGDVHARLGSQLTTLLNDAKFDQQRLRGRMLGDLGIEEGSGQERYHLQFYLDLRGGALKGAVETHPSPILPFWTELNKTTESDAKQ